MTVLVVHGDIYYEGRGSRLTVGLQGTNDVVYSVANAKEEIKLFTNSPDARLEVIQGGQHFLSASNPKEVNDYVIGFVKKYTK
jgi:pimeloyl-ACP methyl ester carboxylesterase